MAWQRRRRRLRRPDRGGGGCGSRRQQGAATQARGSRRAAPVATAAAGGGDAGLRQQGAALPAAARPCPVDMPHADAAHRDQSAPLLPPLHARFPPAALRPGCVAVPPTCGSPGPVAMAAVEEQGSDGGGGGAGERGWRRRSRRARMAEHEAEVGTDEDVARTAGRERRRTRRGRPGKRAWRRRLAGEGGVVMTKQERGPHVIEREESV